jgi:hypothetical protein
VVVAAIVVVLTTVAWRRGSAKKTAKTAASDAESVGPMWRIDLGCTALR